MPLRNDRREEEVGDRAFVMVEVGCVLIHKGSIHPAGLYSVLCCYDKVLRIGNGYGKDINLIHDMES